MKTRRMNGNTLELLNDKDEIVLSIYEELVDNAMVIRLKGSMQNDVCLDFEDELMAALLVCDRVRLDFSEVTYMSSKALNALLVAQRMIDERDNSEMSLFNVSQDAMKVFEESGYSEILLIEEN